MFGATLADLQLTQAALGEMATDIDAAALLTYRAAWRRDVAEAADDREAAMAKMTATETAQHVIDRALQMFGGRGVGRGEIVERLYREIRALRIYEGATEVQKLIIARETSQGPRVVIGIRSATCMKILQPDGWAKPVGYANGVSARGPRHSRRWPDRLEQGLRIRDRRFRRAGQAEFAECRRRARLRRRRPSTSSR